jgi:hypothetical protein
MPKATATSARRHSLGRHARLHLFVPFLVLMEPNERADSAPRTRDPHLSLL